MAHKTAKAAEVLNPLEINGVVDFFLYHATPELRGQLMAHLPAAYSKLYGGQASIYAAVMQNVDEEMKKVMKEGSL